MTSILGLPAWLRLAVRTMAVAAVAAAALIAAGRSPEPAHASFHLMKIDEIMAGVPGDPNAQYVELRMTFAGQNLVGTHSIKVYNSAGTEVGSFTFGGSVPNGTNQSTILIATTQAQTFWGVTANLLMNPVLPATGMVCFDAPPFEVDCVPYGDYSAGNIRKGPASHLQLGVSATMSLQRVGDLQNAGISNARLDFAYACPTPKNNAGVTGAFSGGDPDGDGLPGCMDNCPDISNGQTNSDRNFIDLPPSKAFDDTTFVSADVFGDDCDNDDDNDGRPDSTETAGGSCGAFAGVTSTTLGDTDGDRTLDSAECQLGSDPNNPASVPPPPAPGTDTDNDRLPDAMEAGLGAVVGDPDSDDDGMLDGVEFRFYNSRLNSTNSDSDICRDGKEVASVNNDNNVTSADLSQVAQSFGTSSNPNYVADFDTNKEGNITSADLSFVAQQFGVCP